MCLIIGQNLQPTQVWLAVILVGVRGSFLSETSLSWWRSWRGSGPRCPCSNPGNGHILFIPFIFVWKTRRSPGLEIFRERCKDAESVGSRGRQRQVALALLGIRWQHPACMGTCLFSWDASFLFSVCFPRSSVFQSIQRVSLRFQYISFGTTYNPKRLTKKKLNFHFSPR